ncbi:MAG TPA: TIGR03943 family protein [Pseudonocardiaceae bacterium]|nr:TIGR03943 family protein [Pseudonocardiaceae bacterium]
MRRETANVLLLLVGGALLKITLNGTYLRYVKPTAKPWVLAAGVVMVGLAVVAIVLDVVGRHRHVDGHQHSGRWVWLLMLPVLAIFLVVPPALGADSVLRAGNRAAPAVSRTFPPLPRGTVVPIGMSDFITRGVWDSSGSLSGRTVALTGFVVHGNGIVYVARLVITCCAADATPMKVALTGGQADRLPDDQWIQVDGMLRPGSATEANGYTPTVVVSALAIADAPADPYEY